MAWQDYLNMVQFGTSSQLTVSPDNPTVARVFYATDTNALYVWNPSHTGGAAWELLFQAKPVTVAQLPTQNLIPGTEAVVSDATAPALGATVAGAGAVQVIVIWSGAAWKVG